MSLTLGEKLRQAREERGFTLSDVAEQTRISSQYLESIENDDYRPLPGGIFNKGFVKSYAKFVGLNEQEALADYTQFLAHAEIAVDEDPKVYRPEVLTDDRSNSSMAPTLILAIVILAAMTAGILFLVNYLRQPAEPTVAGNTQRPAANSTPEVAADRDQTPSVPAMSAVKVEFKALTVPVSLSATNDGESSSNVVTPGTTAVFEPKESLKLSYARSLAETVQMSINGKSISLPATPLDNPRRSVIEFEINKDNLPQIWTNASITTNGPTANPDTEAEPPAPAATPVRPAATPVPKPAATPANANKPAPAPKPKQPVETPTPRS